MANNNTVNTKDNFADLPEIPVDQKLSASEVNEITGFQKSPVQKISNAFVDSDIIVDGTKEYSTAKVIAGATHTITASDDDAIANTLSSEHKQGNELKARYQFDQDCTLTLVNFDTLGNNVRIIDPIKAGTYDFIFSSNARGINLLILRNFNTFDSIVHIKTQDRGFDDSFLDLGVGIAYPLIIESQDAFQALVSANEGSHGSGINLMEVEAGVLSHAWTILTKTSGAAASRLFEILAGTDKNYTLNPQRFFITFDGQNSAIGRIELFDDSYKDNLTDFAVLGPDVRIRSISSDLGTWGSAFTLDQMDESEGTNFENIWAIVRQTNGDGDGDGRLSITYGTNADPALNTEVAIFNTSGDVEFKQKVSIGVSTFLNSLDVAGGAAIGSSYAGISTAPADGMIIEGGLGIGTNSGPASGLKIAAGQIEIEAGNARLILDTTSSDASIQFQQSNANTYLIKSDGSGTMSVNSLVFANQNAVIEALILDQATGNVIIPETKLGVGAGALTPATKLHVDGAITQNELSADPSDPAEGQSVTWQSDGTGSGDDGDIMMKITAGAVTKLTTLVDFSAI